jgi:DNA replication protein DnaC
MSCEICNGTGWTVGANGAERCRCWIDGVTARLIDAARIPPRYARCTIDNFVTYPNEKLMNALAQARKFAAAFPATTKGLCLIGPPGIGKTHIATAVLRQAILEKRARGLFYDVRDLLRVIRSTYNPVVRTAEMDILRPVMEADLLVLDDLGAEKPSEWVEETMNLIVNTRYNERRPTIFTTNYIDIPDETDLDSLKVRVGFRMHSRLHEMCDFLNRRRRLSHAAAEQRRERPHRPLAHEQGPPRAAVQDAWPRARATRTRRAVQPHARRTGARHP